MFSYKNNVEQAPISGHNKAGIQFTPWCLVLYVHKGIVVMELFTFYRFGEKHISL